MKELSIYDLKRLVSYDPETGVFKRKISRMKKYPAGSVIGTVGKDGYLQGSVLSIKFQLHRLAWFYHYGYHPNGCIDHIDGDKKNNKIENLRIADKSQNAANRGPQKNNKSGFKGVHWCQRSKKWVACLKKNRKAIFVKYFKSKLEAVEAYDAAHLAAFGDFAKPNLR